MKKILLTLFATIGMSSLAKAGMLIEPYLGYNFGDNKVTATAAYGGADSKTTVSGSAYGLRLGYKFLVPWVALDYTGFNQKCKGDTSTSDCTATALGLVAGAKLPLVNLWAGYGFSNDVTDKSDTGTTKFKGTYTKVGVGLGFLPIVSLNLEYYINDFKKITLDGGSETNVSDYYSSFKSSSILFSVSVPFNL